MAEHTRGAALTPRVRPPDARAHMCGTRAHSHICTQTHVDSNAKHARSLTYRARATRALGSNTSTHAAATRQQSGVGGRAQRTSLTHTHRRRRDARARTISHPSHTHTFAHTHTCVSTAAAAAHRASRECLLLVFVALIYLRATRILAKPSNRESGSRPPQGRLHISCIRAGT